MWFIDAHTWHLSASNLWPPLTSYKCELVCHSQKEATSVILISYHDCIMTHKQWSRADWEQGGVWWNPQRPGALVNVLTDKQDNRTFWALDRTKTEPLERSNDLHIYLIHFNTRSGSFPSAKELNFYFVATLLKNYGWICRALNHLRGKWHLLMFWL